MRPVFRSILAVVAGIVTGGLLISGVEMISNMVYPLPADADPSDMEAMAAHIATLPSGAFLFVLAAWAVGTLCGAWVAAKIAGRSFIVHGAVIGTVFLLLGVANMLMFPHPIWVWIAGIAIFIGCGYAGGRLAAAR